ncbi:hypothetical protein OUZ56_001049 [Daphnia magna]|uniref:Uncharacterized protein n=1 Tax=Daphnia magna TaxID=35525 RepID=A0ABR0A267_9CRUS|nr:hypothetical protein OUZ56_001049 [Daphnia magna]
MLKRSKQQLLLLLMLPLFNQLRLWRLPMRCRIFERTFGLWYVIPLNLESVTEIKPVVKAAETAEKSAEKAKAAETVVTDDLRTIGHELMATVYAQFI